MTDLVFKKKWEDEADKWHWYGDPEHDADLDADAVIKEIADKAKLLAALQKEYNKSLGKILEELIGFNPLTLSTAAGAAGAGITFSAAVDKVRREKGDKAADALKELLAEAAKGQDVRDKATGVVTSKSNWKGVAPRIGKVLGRRLAAGAGVVGVLATSLALAKVASDIENFLNLTLKMRALRHAMRVEALLIDPERGPTELTFWFRPDAATAARIEAGPKCILFLKITYRWVDCETHDVVEVELNEVKVTETDDGAYKKKLPVKVPKKGIYHPEAVMTWTLSCQTTPVRNTVLFSGVRPMRVHEECESRKPQTPEDF